MRNKTGRDRKNETAEIAMHQIGILIMNVHPIINMP